MSYMMPTSSLAEQRTGSLSTRHKASYASLHNISQNDSCIFSSHMQYNSSVMSMRLAQKESRA